MQTHRHGVHFLWHHMIYALNFISRRYTKVYGRYEGLYNHMRIVENHKMTAWSWMLLSQRPLEVPYKNYSVYMYLIPMNRGIVWRWFHARTLKYAEVMLRNRKTRDCIIQKYFCFDASSCITRSVSGIFISCIYVHLKRISCRIEWFLFQLHSQSMHELLL